MCQGSRCRSGQPAKLTLRRHVAEALHPSAGEDVMFITGGESSAALEALDLQCLLAFVVKVHFFSTNTSVRFVAEDRVIEIRRSELSFEDAPLTKFVVGT